MSEAIQIHYVMKTNHNLSDDIRVISNDICSKEYDDEIALIMLTFVIYRLMNIYGCILIGGGNRVAKGL